MRETDYSYIGSGGMLPCIDSHMIALIVCGATQPLQLRTEPNCEGRN
jgi:hypothetical protein